MKRRRPEFHWDAETNTATCILTDAYDNTYIGIAVCHPEDEDMTSEKTGCEIAFRRASIKVLQASRTQIKHELGALKQLYYSMNRSKQFQKKSYETRMLYRQIKIKEADLGTVREMLHAAQADLREFIDEKEKLYKRIRFNRKVNSHQSENDEN